jgi:hypothetical protein
LFAVFYYVLRGRHVYAGPVKYVRNAWFRFAGMMLYYVGSRHIELKWCGIFVIITFIVVVWRTLTMFSQYTACTYNKIITGQQTLKY